MNILITGARSFIAEKLIDTLKCKNHFLIGTSTVNGAINGVHKVLKWSLGEHPHKDLKKIHIDCAIHMAHDFSDNELSAKEPSNLPDG